MDDIILSLRNVKTQFGENVIHENLDLDVRQGEIIGVIGGSGSGKSVLLRTILGLERHTKGKISIFGKQYHLLTAKERHKIEPTVGCSLSGWCVVFLSYGTGECGSIAEGIHKGQQSASKRTGTAQNSSCRAAY